jgi:hypothetical protein
MARSTWTIPVRQLTEKAKGDMRNVVREVAIEAFTRVILKTPVDTGRLRANWIPSEGEIKEEQNDNVDQGGSSTINSIRQAVSTFPVVGTIWLANSLPYASVIEYGGYPNPPKHPTGKTSGGFSIQAPQGMVRVTVEEINSIISDAIARLKA